MNLSIAKKGIILVLVPLIVELVFAIALFVLEQRAEEVAAEEQHSKAVVSQINDLIKLSYDAGTTAVLYGATKSKIMDQRYHKLTAETIDELKKLGDLVAQEPAMLTEYQALATKMQEALSMVNQVVAAIESGESTELLQATPFRERVKRNSNAFMDQAARMVEMENRKRNSMPLPEAKVRSLFKICLLSIIPANLLIAAVLAVFYTKDIGNRLGILVDNTKLLKGGRELKAPLPGTDEIAHLDQVFHEMAVALSRARKAEQEAFERIRSMIQSMPIGLLTIDKAGTICAVNPRIEEIFGYRENELIGSDIRRLFPGSRGNGDSSSINNLIPKAVGQTFKFEAVKKSGSTFPTELSLTEYKTIDGDRLLATIIDITERQKIEQLRKEFVAMVSHDLKSPLTSINTSLALIAQGTYGNLSEKGLGVASDAEHETVRLITLIGDLLDLARMEAGRLELNCSPVSLDKVFEQSLRAVAGLAEQKKVTIDTFGASISINGDRDRLVQVLVNLLSNSLRYSPSGGMIKVSAQKSNGYSEIRVTDQGPGVPESLKETIFERFEQLDVLNASMKGAAGLGLSICKAIIEAHEGSIGVESQEGSGSTFWFRIPLAEERKPSKELPIA
jgi:PAS domain S-box-containing protein